MRTNLTAETIFIMKQREESQSEILGRSSNFVMLSSDIVDLKIHNIPHSI